jgi:CBS domain-containing protein
MTPMPTAVLEDTSIESALGHMRVGRMRRLPVVNGAGTLVGIITLDDVLALLAEEFSLIGGLLEREAPHRPIGKP